MVRRLFVWLVLMLTCLIGFVCLFDRFFCLLVWLVLFACLIGSYVDLFDWFCLLVWSVLLFTCLIGSFVYFFVGWFVQALLANLSSEESADEETRATTSKTSKKARGIAGKDNISSLFASAEEVIHTCVLHVIYPSLMALFREYVEISYI